MTGCNGCGSLDRERSVGRRGRGQRRGRAAVGSKEETSPCGVSTVRWRRWRRLRRRRRGTDRAREWARGAAFTGKKIFKKKTLIGNGNSSWSEDRHRKMETYGYLVLSLTMFVPMKQLYVTHCDKPVCKFYKKLFLYK